MRFRYNATDFPTVQIKMAHHVVNSTDNKQSFLKNGNKQWVKLNVGGSYFLTTKTTLARDPNSFLYRLVQEDSDLISDKVSASWSIFRVFQLIIELF